MPSKIFKSKISCIFSACLFWLLAVVAFPQGQIGSKPNQRNLLQFPQVANSRFLPKDDIAINSGESRQNDDDENDSEEKTTSLLGLAINRIPDFYKGVQGIVNGAIGLNLKQVLHGSFQFINPTIRPGVEAILDSIIGSPLNPNKTTSTTERTSDNDTAGPPAENVIKTVPSGLPTVIEQNATFSPIVQATPGVDGKNFTSTSLPFVEFIPTTVQESDDNNNDESEEEDDEGQKRALKKKLVLN